jgi:hypothetical protein
MYELLENLLYFFVELLHKEYVYTQVDAHAGRDSVEKQKQLLCTKIQLMWNMKCFVIPVITGATGIVTKGLKKCQETVPGKHSTDSLQKKKLNLSGEVHHRFKMRSTMGKKTSNKEVVVMVVVVKRTAK